MTVGKPFAIDKTEVAPPQMTRLQAISDFFVFIALSAAYIIQVRRKCEHTCGREESLTSTKICDSSSANSKNWLEFLYQLGSLRFCKS